MSKEVQDLICDGFSLCFVLVGGSFSVLGGLKFETFSFIVCKDCIFIYVYVCNHRSQEKPLER